MNPNRQRIDHAIAMRSLAGVTVPDTPLVARSISYAREHSEPFLFNHVMRSWLFAAALAELDQTPHDAEVLAVATVLHDLGLAQAFQGPLRFEVEGANAARNFALDSGLDDERAQLRVGWCRPQFDTFHSLAQATRGRVVHRRYRHRLGGARRRKTVEGSGRGDPRRIPSARDETTVHECSLWQSSRPVRRRPTTTSRATSASASCRDIRLRPRWTTC